MGEREWWRARARARRLTRRSIAAVARTARPTRASLRLTPRYSRALAHAPIATLTTTRPAPSPALPRIIPSPFVLPPPPGFFLRFHINTIFNTLNRLSHIRKCLLIYYFNNI